MWVVICLLSLSQFLVKNNTNVRELKAEVQALVKTLEAKEAQARKTEQDRKKVGVA